MNLLMAKRDPFLVFLSAIVKSFSKRPLLVLWRNGAMGCYQHWLVVAVLVRWISPLDSYIYQGTWSIMAMDCPPSVGRT